MSRLALNHPELIALYRQWLEQCSGETLPASSDVTPASMRRWLDNLVVVDALKSGELRYAYYGANLSAAFGTDMVGCSIEQLPDAQRSLLRTEYDGIRADRIPTARQYTADFGGVQQTWERLSLPFFDPDGEVEKILVAAYRME